MFSADFALLFRFSSVFLQSFKGFLRLRFPQVGFSSAIFGAWKRGKSHMFVVIMMVLGGSIVVIKGFLVFVEVL